MILVLLQLLSLPSFVSTFAGSEEQTGDDRKEIIATLAFTAIMESNMEQVTRSYIRLHYYTTRKDIPFYHILSIREISSRHYTLDGFRNIKRRYSLIRMCAAACVGCA